MVHPEHTKQTTYLAEKPNCKSGKKWTGRKRKETNQNEGKQCFAFSNHITPLLVTLSSTLSSESSWILRNNILELKNASIPFLWSSMQWESTGFLSSYWIYCWSWAFICLKTHMKILGSVMPPTGAVSGGQWATAWGTLRKEQRKGIHPCLTIKYSLQG